MRKKCENETEIWKKKYINGIIKRYIKQDNFLKNSLFNL